MSAYLAITAVGTNHAARPETYGAHDGMAIAVCRSDLVVSVEHENDVPIIATTHDVSCVRCAKYLAATDTDTMAATADRDESRRRPILCDWCDEPATATATVNGWTDRACAGHLAAWFATVKGAAVTAIVQRNREEN